ncbi:MAG: hypothetical protein ACI8QZ_001438 [Chlamydiales bacterium]|jgi:hypothetical protein
MATPVPSRVCPTRVDHTPALFAHIVSAGHCQKRQRSLYHKCFTCAYNNDHVSLNGLPPTPGMGPRVPAQPAVAEPAPVVPQVGAQGQAS